MSNYLEKQLSLMNTLKKTANKSLMHKPEGSLQICRNKNTEQYFYRSAPGIKKGEYIRKEKMAFIRALAQKNYDQQFLAAVDDLEKKLKSGYMPWDYNSMHDFYQFLASVFQNLTPGRQKLVTPYVMPDKMYIQAWLNFPYMGKPFQPDDPVIETRRGERVRSKSEKFIADKLWEMKLPYRYEFPLITQKLGTIFPDFTLLDIQNRQNVILEHFGRMQDENYCNRTLTKLEVYEQEGWYLGEGFLFTMESAKHLIDLKHFERLIQHRFPYLPYFSTQSHN
jgi:hypothetical protein